MAPTSPTPPKPKSKLTFEELSKWARDDSHVLEREMMSCVRQVVGQAGVKLRIAGIMLARNQLAKIARLSMAIEGPGGVEEILFNRERLLRMKNSELIELWRTGSRLQFDAEKSYINAVLDPDSKLSPDVDDLKAAMRADEMLADEVSDNVREILLTKIGALADRLRPQRAAISAGVVTAPPVVM